MIKIRAIILCVADTWKYDFLSRFKNIIIREFNQKEIFKKIMSFENLKKHGKEINILIPKLIKDRSKIPRIVLSQEKDIEWITEKIPLLEIKFKTKIILKKEDTYKKANKAMPSKPAISIIYKRYYSPIETLPPLFQKMFK